MVEVNFKKIGHILTLLLAIILLGAGKKFLIGNPLLGCGILLIFSLMYILFAGLMSAGLFVYPATILFSISYFLFFFNSTYIPPLLPLLAVPLLFSLIFLAQIVKKELYFRPLIHCQYLIGFFFLGYILFQWEIYSLQYPLAAAITLFFYALLYHMRYRQVRKKSGIIKTRFHYLSLFCLSLSLLFLLYALKSLATESYSLFLIIIFIIYMDIGVHLTRRGKAKDALPLYIMGFIGLFLAPLYAVPNISLLAVIQLIYSIHFWKMYRVHSTITTQSTDQSRIRTNALFYKIIIHIPTLIFLGLFCYQKFPINILHLIVSLIYTALYLKIGWSSEHAWKGRSFLTYAAGLFLNIAFFEGFFHLISIQEIKWELIYTILPLWLFFFLGNRAYRRGKTVFGKSIYEGQFLTLLISFLILFSKVPSAFFLKSLLLLGIGYLLLQIMFMLTTGKKIFLYPIAFILTFLYYGLLSINFPGTGWISLAFLPLGILSLSMALRLHKKNKGSSLFYFWGIIVTIFSLFSMRPDFALSLYALSIWAALYLLVSVYTSKTISQLRSLLMTFGHILALSNAALLINTGNIPAGIFAGFLLTICYALVFSKTGKRRYLYPASLAFSVSYILVFISGKPWEIIHLYSLPLLFILYGAGLGFKQFRQGINPLKHIGHLNALFLTLMVILSHGAINHKLVIISMLAYALLYLALSKAFPVYDFIFLAAGFVSLSYYFSLFMISSIPSSQRVLYFFFSALALCLIGYLWKKKRGLEITWPIFDVALIIALLCSVIPLIRGNTGISQIILLMAAIIYLFMAAQTKKDMYIYLTTLTLGLLAYQFLGMAQQKFTQDLLVYVLYLILSLGIFFFIPFFKRLLQYQGPGYLMATTSWKAVVFYSLGMVACGGILLSVYSIEIANYPGFCTQCHYMKPYAEAWEHSSHKDVSCVLCHYEPGIKSTVKAKINGMVTVVKYVTGTYSTKPSSEVSDMACLREGCHTKANLNKEITFYKDVKFTHKHHLEELRRGKKLRCTSCHSQIVQGAHMKVTQTVCFTCHMKGIEKEGLGIGRCTVCHTIPTNSVSYMGIEFEHQEFLENKPELLCLDCHFNVTQGDAPVPEEGCFSCHVEKNKTRDPKILHNIHITEHKVECFECHLEIQHGNKPLPQEVKLNCQDCHNKSHRIPEKMFMGMGAVDLPGSPDPMFTAKVSCRGCHKYLEKVEIGDISFITTKAKAKACDDCHGQDEGYGEMMEEWQLATRETLAEISSFKKELDQPLNEIKDQINNPVWKDLKGSYNRATANLKFVTTDGSFGVHNNDYTEQILAKIHTDLKNCLAILKTQKKFEFSQQKKKPKSRISDQLVYQQQKYSFDNIRLEGKK